MLILSNYFTMIADLFFELIEPRNFLLKGKHVRGMLGWHLSSKNFCLGCVVLMCNDLGRVKYSLGMGVGPNGGLWFQRARKLKQLLHVLQFVFLLC